jgi:hypothetical protein
VVVAAECEAQQIVDVVDAEVQPTRAAGATATASSPTGWPPRHRRS